MSRRGANGEAGHDADARGEEPAVAGSRRSRRRWWGLLARRGPATISSSPPPSSSSSTRPSNNTTTTTTSETVREGEEEAEDEELGLGTVSRLRDGDGEVLAPDATPSGALDEVVVDDIINSRQQQHEQHVTGPESGGGGGGVELGEILVVRREGGEEDRPDTETANTDGPVAAAATHANAAVATGNSNIGDKEKEAADTSEEDEERYCRICMDAVSAEDLNTGVATLLGCACLSGFIHYSCAKDYMQNSHGGTTCEICLEDMTNMEVVVQALREERRQHLRNRAAMLVLNNNGGGGAGGEGADGEEFNDPRMYRPGWGSRNPFAWLLWLLTRPIVCVLEVRIPFIGGVDGPGCVTYILALVFFTPHLLFGGRGVFFSQFILFSFIFPCFYFFL